MLRSEAFAPFSPAAPRTPATTGNGDVGAGFGSSYARLRGDIALTIRDGFATSSPADGTIIAGPVGELAAAFSPPAVAGEATRRDFLERIAPWARDTAFRLGVSEDLVAAHAALESGWGQKPVTTASGASTHNLFGIKAGEGWDGGTADAATHEFIGGAMQPLVQRFRAYGSEAGAFADYTRLLQSPRYAGVRGVGADAGAFARGLVQGGYATDPAYARKLEGVVGAVRQLRADRFSR